MARKHGLGGAQERGVGTGDAGNDALRLNYGQVTRLLTSVLKVDGGKAVALSGRLKHFQRSRFPGGTNTGPGPRAVYRVDQVFALVFAFRLLAMRFPPRDAAAAVEANRHTLRGMVLSAWHRSRESDGDGNAGESGNVGPLLAAVIPDGLEDLRRAGFEDGPADVLSPVPQRQVWAWMRGVDPLPTPGLVLLDVDAIVAETLKTVEDLGLASETDIRNGFDDLAAQIEKAGQSDAGDHG